MGNKGLGTGDWNRGWRIPLFPYSLPFSRLPTPVDWGHSSKTRKVPTSTWGHDIAPRFREHVTAALEEAA
jgi:hypothetical protein